MFYIMATVNSIKGIGWYWLHRSNRTYNIWIYVLINIISYLIPFCFRKATCSLLLWRHYHNPHVKTLASVSSSKKILIYLKNLNTQYHFRCFLNYVYFCISIFPIHVLSIKEIKNEPNWSKKHDIESGFRVILVMIY